MSIKQAGPALGASRPPRTRSDLTIAQRWLLQIMFGYQFGRVENLRIEQGQPTPDRSLRIIRATRPGRNNAGLKVPVSNDPELKQAVWDLFDEIKQLQNGYIVRLEFRHGLPFLLETTAATALGGLSVGPTGESGA